MTSTTSETCLVAALAYAAKGWAVLPLHWPTDSGCSCRRPKCPTPAKHPLTTNGVKDASRDPNTIREWWRKWPQANLAIATGTISGLVVVDIDPRHGGDESAAKMGLHEVLGATPTVLTGGGGRHLYFKHPGERIRNRVGIAPGIDVRGDGGYVVAPPSVHISQSKYGWHE